MNYALIGTAARQLLLAAGTILVSKGYVDDAGLETIVGGLIAVGSSVWSFFRARANAKAVEVAKTVVPS